jgi:phage terminase large subunit GpA-like protein
MDNSSTPAKVRFSEGLGAANEADDIASAKISAMLAAHYAEQVKTDRWKKTISHDRWICQTCDRVRRTDFCPACGESKPAQNDELGSSLNALRQVAASMWSRHQAAANQARTMEARGIWIDAGGYTRNGEREAETHWKRAADLAQQAAAVEWAIARISGA